MIITLLSVGKKMPGWIDTGFNEYTRRLTGDCRLQLREVSQVPQGPPQVIRDKEGQKLLESIPKQAIVVALDILGKPWDTPQLADHLKRWKESSLDVCLLAGGPEGLSDACLAAASARWSLSPLTFPHPLVRVIVAEQIYRADTILRNHPYHRA